MRRFPFACWLPLVLFALAAVPARADVDFKELRAASAAIEDIYLEGRKELYLAPGTNGQLAAKTSPDNLKERLRWKIVGYSEHCTFEIEDDTGSIKVPESSGEGWIEVEASAEGCPPKTRRIEIGCECTGPEGACRDQEAGAATAHIGSVDVRLSLGQGDRGRSAGQLILYAEEPLAVLTTPEALAIDSGEDVTTIYRDGQLMQILTPRVIATFVRFSPTRYEIHFYDIAFRGRPTEDGLFSLDPAAVPLAVCRIENPDATGQTIHSLAISETRNGKKREFLYSYEASEHSWTLVSGNGLKIESRAETTNADGDRVVRSEVAGPDGTPVQVVETVYRPFDFGEKRIRETLDPEGVALVTRFRYQTSPGPGYGKLIARIEPDGGWVRYDYDGEGRIVRETRPFLDAPFDGPEDQTVVVTKDYTPLDPADTGARRDRHRPRQVIERVKGIETARTYYAYIRDKDGGRTEIVERCTQQGRPYRGPSNLRTVTRYFAGEPEAPQAGRIRSRLSAEGRLTRYTYEKGRLLLSLDPAGSRFVPGQGRALRTTVTHGTPDHPRGIPFQTTRETTLTDALGREKLKETFVCTEDGFDRIDWQYLSHDRLGRVVETLHANGNRTESTWGCCSRASETGIDGVTIRFVYDDLKRLVSRVDTAAGVVTDFTYDAAGRRLSTVQHSGDLRLSRSSRYDGAGRLVSQADPAGLLTRYAYDGNSVTTIRPGGATEIATRHLDGRPKSVTGTGVVARFYRYGVNADGSQWTVVCLGGSESPRWEKTTRDPAGRIVRLEKPGFEGIETTRNRYDDKGRLIRTEAPGRAAVLYTYDRLGNRTMAGLDVDGDRKLRPASLDRIAATRQAFKRIDGAWWREAVQAVYAREGSARATTVSTRRQRLTGWEARVIAEQVAVGRHGDETRAVVTLDRFKRTRAGTVYRPDSTIPAQAVYVDGRLAAVTGKTGLTRTFGYDALGRRIAVEDPRKGLMQLHYDSGGRIASVEDAAGNRTRFAYDPDSGYRIAEYNSLGKATRYAYNARGQLIRTWGEVPYPAAYRYDRYGQLLEMRTFRSGSSWNGATWPADAAPGDPTRWHYHPATGLLLAKEDALGNRTSYTYGPGGFLATRTWARLQEGKPLSTRYDVDPLTGDLLKIDYSDGTPDIVFAYNRLGRKIRVSDAAGVHHFVYDEVLQLVSEGLTGMQIYRIGRSYDDLGRATGIGLDDRYALSYGYDTRGRFHSVNWRMGAETGETVYRYLVHSDLLAGMESANGLFVDYAYEPDRDVKTAVANRYGDRLISRYAYQYDPLGRRINATNSGEAFEEDGFWLYGYNDRHEVTSASRFLGNDLKDQTRPQPDWARAYRYDPIGNRIEAVEGTASVAYRTNALNQYETISYAHKGDETLSYDADGNLVQDGRFRYRWNAENRLVAVEPKYAVPGAKRLEFAYDYLGRRFMKKVWEFDSTRFVLAETIYFVYDGWNMIKETRTKANGSVDRFYVWGLDLSQSLQGAGGVGGLLATSDGSLTHCYLFDANGNVGQQIDKRNGFIKSHYEYEAYGKSLVSKCSDSEIYQFGSKVLDKESNSLFYGYRYLSPRIGRWIKKDPISESGGINLYSFANNNGITFNDVLGLLLYAFDGTGNDSVRDYPEGEYTNVFLLNLSYSGGSFIASGPGSSFGTAIYGGATGAGTGNRLEDAYKHFKKNYKPERNINGKIIATIDIIGFSRGAAIAREFANVLANPEHSRFKGYKGCPVPIRFVGLFDTVDMTAFIDLNLKLPDLVEHAAQAVAADEKRSSFPLSTIDDSKPNFDQKYFKGDHSDIGRGHGNDTNFLSLAPLFYIYHHGISAGVPFDDLPEDLYENFSSSTTPHDLSEEVWYWRLIKKVDRGYTGAINGVH